MKLLVDVGNHSVKWCVVEHALTLDDVAQLHRHVQRFPLKHARHEHHLHEHWSTLAKPDSAIIANVAGEQIAQALSAYLQRHCKQVTFAATQAQQLGVQNAYQNHKQLGIDRWMMIIAAAKLHANKNCCVIASGSALTIDVIDRHARHRGGWIIPGLDMMRESLAAGTAQVHVPQSPNTSSALGTDTASCVVNGCTQAVHAFVEKAISRVQEQFSEDILFIGTGGAIKLSISQKNVHKIHIEPDMVIKGLSLISDSI